MLNTTLKNKSKKVNQVKSLDKLEKLSLQDLLKLKKGSTFFIGDTQNNEVYTMTYLDKIDYRGDKLYFYEKAN